MKIFDMVLGMKLVLNRVCVGSVLFIHHEMNDMAVL